MSQDVIWTLEDHKLNSLPCYTAISYCWGRGELLKDFILNGFRFKVLDSVFAILEAIRTNTALSSASRSWWWIDSICINQNDVTERESQIKLMGIIYKSAGRTVGWFGEGSGDVDQEQGSEFTSRGESAIESLFLLREYRTDIMKGKEKDLKAVKKLVNSIVVWEGVEELLLRPWWRRVWTLQEYLIAPKFEFWYGKSHIDKGDLKIAMHAMYEILKEPEYKASLSRKSWLPAWNRRRLFMWQRKKGCSATTRCTRCIWQ